jgi:dGTPase
LTHTLEVTQIARTIARALRLNEDLTEAIALGHDLGHTPFGHAGETALNEIHPGGFQHNLQSLRVVDLLEKRSDEYPGLNLTLEVRDGIANHTTNSPRPKTLEGQIVRYADRIAYINHDIDDAIRAGIIRQDLLPKDPVSIIGSNSSIRIDRMVRDVIINSECTNVIGMSSEVYQAMNELRDFLFENVYLGSKATEERKAVFILKTMYGLYLEDINIRIENTDNKVDSRRQAVCDYIAGMTDRYVISEYMKYFIPQAWNPSTI